MEACDIHEVWESEGGAVTAEPRIPKANLQKPDCPACVDRAKCEGRFDVKARPEFCIHGRD